MGTKEGIKYDSGKPTVGEMIKDFGPAIREVARVWKFGADKYEKSNWQKLDDAENRYTNALVRHLLAEEEESIRRRVASSTRFPRCLECSCKTLVHTS